MDAIEKTAPADTIPVSVITEHLGYAVKDVNISVALNDKKQIQANEYVVNALTNILERAGHKVVAHKHGKTHMKLSVNGNAISI